MQVGEQILPFERRESMDILHLTYFVEVARQESFTKASEALFVSQSSISKLIKNLENELGVPLFDRTPRGVCLTGAGARLFEKAKVILDTFHGIQGDLSAFTSSPRGRLRIGMPPLVQTLDNLPRIVAEFKLLHPQVQLSLIEVGARMVERKIDNGDLDVGIVVLPTKAEAELELVSFVEEPLELIVHAEHPFALRPAASIGDLREESFVLYQEDFTLRDHIMDTCCQYGFTPNIVCETAQWDFMVEIVASRLGIAFLPRSVCRKIHNPNVKSLPLISEIKNWHLAFAWKNTNLHSATRAWLEYAFRIFGIHHQVVNLTEHSDSHMQRRILP